MTPKGHSSSENNEGKHDDAPPSGPRPFSASASIDLKETQDPSLIPTRDLRLVSSSSSSKASSAISTGRGDSESDLEDDDDRDGVDATDIAVVVDEDEGESEGEGEGEGESSRGCDTLRGTAISRRARFLGGDRVDVAAAALRTGATTISSCSHSTASSRAANNAGSTTGEVERACSTAQAHSARSSELRLCARSAVAMMRRRARGRSARAS